MKQNLFIATCVCMGFFIFSCSKDRNNTNPSQSPVSVKVVEFGSGLPIAGADFSYGFCARSADFGCAEYKNGSAITNTDGLITVPREAIGHYSFSSYTFRKNGYWINAEGGFLFLPYGSDFPPPDLINGSNSADGWQVKLFPIVNIQIHAKNTTNTLGDTTFFLKCQGQCCSGPSQRDGNLISLTGGGQDTTFNYPAFGNTENHFFIINRDDTDTLFSHSQFIAKGDNINLEISY